MNYIYLINHATKADLKNEAGVETSKFARKIHLANLKSDVDKLDIDKLKHVSTNLSNLKSKVDKQGVDKLVPVLFYLSKLSDVVKNDVIERNVYNAQIKNIEDKIPHITNLATNTALNAKIDEVKTKIPNITNLANTAALTVLENKMSNVSNLVKKKKTTTVKLKIELLLINMINIVYDI